MESSANEVAELIVEHAKRDVLNGVGRVLITDLINRGYSRESLTAALKIVEKSFRVVVVGDYIKVFFSESRSGLHTDDSR